MIVKRTMPPHTLSVRRTVSLSQLPDKFLITSRTLYHCTDVQVLSHSLIGPSASSLGDLTDLCSNFFQAKSFCRELAFDIKVSRNVLSWTSRPHTAYGSYLSTRINGIVAERKLSCFTLAAILSSIPSLE